MLFIFNDIKNISDESGTLSRGIYLKKIIQFHSKRKITFISFWHFYLKKM